MHPAACQTLLSRTLLHFSKRLTQNSLCHKQLSTSSISMSKAAVILHGNGVYDGTEVHEASACLMHLSRAGASVGVFAPDIAMMHTIDHTKGAPAEPNRNVLTESARISRGNISDLTELKAADYDMVVIPGGFGAAKNLSNWAVKGPDCTVNDEVERVIKEFHSLKKPIAMCCISPVLAAKVISGCEVTVGKSSGACWPYAETCAGIEKLGVKCVEKEVDDIHVDSANKLVTSPAFMYQNEKQGWNSLHLISDGIGKMITAAINLTK